MIGIGQIQLGESPCPSELIKGFPDERQRISVFDCDIVETPIIYTKAEASIRLPIEEDMCSGGGFGRADEPIGQIGLDVSLQGFQLYQAQAVNGSEGWLLTFFQFNGMLIHPGIFWEFRCIFRQKDVTIVGILHRNLNDSFIEQQSLDLDSALGSTLNSTPNFDLNLSIKIYSHFFLLPDGYMHIKSLAIQIQCCYNKFLWINQLDLLGGLQGFICGIELKYECFLTK